MCVLIVFTSPFLEDVFAYSRPVLLLVLAPLIKGRVPVGIYTGTFLNGIVFLTQTCISVITSSVATLVIIP